MGGALQRLEILLIGLVVLLAGAVAALLLMLRPPSQPAYQSSTPKPLVTHAPALPTSAPGLGVTSVPTQRATTAPIQLATAAPAVSAPAIPPARPPQSHSHPVLWRRRATHRLA
jgi:hypothetical protein